jgi:hypothetical protein
MLHRIQHRGRFIRRFCKNLKKQNKNLPTTARIIRCQKFIDSLAIDRVDLLEFIDWDEFAEGQVFVW